MFSRRSFLKSLALGSAAAGMDAAKLSRHLLDAMTKRFRSASSGMWSSLSTWEGHEVPGPGSVVQILPGHNVVYDVKSDHALRVVHILGSLSFAPDRDTRLDVGLLKVGGDTAEDGANCSGHSHSYLRPALRVGTWDRPISASHTALIRLVYFEGFNQDSLPAIVCCGGRMDFHGTPISRTWVKLGVAVRPGDTEIMLAEPVRGWRPGDRIILTGTVRQTVAENTFRESVRDHTQTEERLIRALDGQRLVLDQPASFGHICDGSYRGDVANLSRNVVVESAGEGGRRGHTMYHHGSAGAISYAEFRRLGKRGVLGRYSVHFHRARDTMRGTSVVGASIWDSDNRWITVHGTDYLVVRDCVGYNSIGHGFFLEDGTEVFNVFDRNLAVQGRNGTPLPNQVLPFDHNSGSGFWWANSLNTFTRNVACECDVYGFRFDMQKTKSFDPVLSVPRTDDSPREVDVRTLPFIQFEDNESHCQRNHAFNLGGLGISLDGGCAGVGPDVHHPFLVRRMRVWNSHWSFHPLAPSVMVEGYDIHDCAYGLWKPRFENHAYHDVHMEKISQHVIFEATGHVPPNLPWEEKNGSLEQLSKNIGPAAKFDLQVDSFPTLLDPVDDLPPVVIATQAGPDGEGHITVRGTAADVGPIAAIQVNGHAARALRPNFAEWEAVVPEATQEIELSAADVAGNISSTKFDWSGR